MFELLKAGGWVIIPLIILSVIAMAIIAERFWTLRESRVTPKNLVQQVWTWVKQNDIDKNKLVTLKKSSPLGEILAVGLLNHRHGRDTMKESIEEAGRQVVLELEKFMTLLGSIAAVSPLLGLLGTVIGMIKVFTVITVQGVGNATSLADGISEALITTAVGLAVAIPTLFFHRYFTRRVDELVISMEQEALKMVEVLHGEREKETLKG